MNEPDIVVMCDPAFLGMVRARRARDGTFLLLQHDVELIAEDAARLVYAQIMQEILEVHKRIPDLEVLILSKGLITSPQERALTYIFPFPVTVFYNPPQERLASIYASADVFLYTSETEGFGLPVLEAFACGVAVVTTDNGGQRVCHRR